MTKSVYPPVSVEVVEAALAHIDPNCSREQWVKAGMAIQDELESAGKPLFMEWSSRGSSFSKRDAEATWNSFSPGSGITIGTLFAAAKEGGFRFEHKGDVSEEELQRRRQEREERMKRYEAEQKAKKERQERKAATAEELAARLPELLEHEYLDLKRCKAYCLREWNDRIFIPVYSMIDDSVTSYQTIGMDVTADGGYKPDKKFCSGGSMDHSYICLPCNIIRNVNLQKVVFCEGYATGATIHEATGLPVIVCFNCGNMKKVLSRFVMRSPASEIIVAADNDWHHADGRNPGIESAREAITRAGKGRLAYPHFTAEQIAQFKADEIQPTDFNDLVSVLGWSMEQVRAEVLRTEDVIKEAADPVERQAAIEAMKPFLQKDTYDNSRSAICTAMRFPSIIGYELAFDTFTNVFQSRMGKGPLRQIDEDTIFTKVSLKLEAFKIKKPSTDVVKESLKYVAKEYGAYDSCIAWLEEHIPEWDGVPRVADFFLKHCECHNEIYSDEYVKAVGEYFFTATWGRMMAVDVPVKADISPMLIGKQGIGKSTLVKAICPRSDWFGTLDFADKNDDMFRKMIGKVLMEFSEIAGADKRTRESVKAFLSKENDAWVPKYKEQTVTMNRRCTFVMTTNVMRPISDSTGGRRHAPLVAQKIHLQDVTRDNLQLWAEAKVLYEQNGVMFQDVEKCSKQDQVAQNFTAELCKEAEILAYAEKHTQLGGFRLVDLLTEVYQMSAESAERSKSLQMTVSDILTREGYVSKRGYCASTRSRPWMWFRDH